MAAPGREGIIEDPSESPIVRAEPRALGAKVAQMGEKIGQKHRHVGSIKEEKSGRRKSLV
jgi:hypothetical protein